MHTLLDDSVLQFEGQHRPSAEMEFSRSLPSHLAEAGELWEVSALEGEFDREAIAAEPGAGALVSAFGAGAATGALVAALFVPALPALAFGAALGAYAGVLATSLWVSSTAGVRVSRRTG